MRTKDRNAARTSGRRRVMTRTPFVRVLANDRDVPGIGDVLSLRAVRFLTVVPVTSPPDKWQRYVDSLLEAAHSADGSLSASPKALERVT